MKKIIFALVFLAFSTAFAEQKDSNGGSGVAAEFIELAHDLVKRVEIKGISEIDLENLKAAVANTKVVTKANLKLRGAAVDAINYPSLKLIEVSVSRWNKLTTTPWVKLQIVFHEYLGILRIDDSDYRISRQILNSDLCHRDPGLVEVIEQAVRRSCDEVTLKELSFITTLAIGKLETFKASDFRDLQNLGRLEINSKISNLVLTPEFTKLLPKLYSLDIVAKQIEVMPGTFAGTNISKYLRLDNPSIVEGSFKGITSDIIMISEIKTPADIEVLQAELATEDYICGTNIAASGLFSLACQKN